MSNHYNNLWVEKYRPKTLDDILLDSQLKDHFKTITDDIPNLLFYGSPGTGKSTLAKIIINDILKCQYLYINASDENGIDTIRNKVISFAQTRSIDSKKKVVILEEADGLTGESLRILRNVMEEYIDTTRFILTANYLNKIIEPIRSRCMLFKLQTDIRSCVARCAEILKKENVKITDESKEKFIEFVTDRYPDLRRIINDLQRFCVTGELVIPDGDELLDLTGYIIKGLAITKISSLDIRKKVIESEKSFSNDYQQLLKNLFDYVYNSDDLSDKIKKSFLIDIGEHLYRDNFVLDHEINFFCCILAMEASVS
ncbi:MAG: AAA family ATPase [Proteobacteria bacterium]|nr:AAA family ATPase [Pseudomonadota bacterium]NBP12895.1 AAA family ATPase [bacterium]